LIIVILTRGHNAKLYKVKIDKDVMKHFFHVGWCTERWNNLEQNVLDALNIINFRNKLKQIRETTMFYGSPLNPMSLTCGLITVEATPGKEPGKETRVNRPRLGCVDICPSMLRSRTLFHCRQLQKLLLFYVTITD